MSFEVNCQPSSSDWTGAFVLSEIECHHTVSEESVLLITQPGFHLQPCTWGSGRLQEQGDWEGECAENCNEDFAFYELVISFLDYIIYLQKSCK